MKFSIVNLFVAPCLVLGIGMACGAPIETRPNVVVILADDLGYGDVQALHPTCPVPTPNLQRLSDAGMRFTNAYAASAYCTPSRYALLTGRYTFRTYLKEGFPGLNGTPDLPYPEPDRLTIQKMLRKLGYRNAVVGKWHLVGEPNDLDFDYSFIHDGYFVKRNTFTENGQPVDYPDQIFPPSSLPIDGATGETITRQQMLDAGGLLTNDDIGWVVPETTERAVRFLEDHAVAHPDRPFFLYFTPHAVHTPYNVPDDWDGIDFRGLHTATDGAGGAAKVNNYANFLALLDHAVGKVLDTLDALGVADETLVLFSSDNGSLGYAWSDQISPSSENAPRGSVADPDYMGPGGTWEVNDDRRGYKTMSFDGGVHVPLLVRWPGTIPGDVERSKPVCLTDVFMTLADLLHVPLGPEVAEDSFSFADYLLDAENGTFPREPIVHHSRYGHLSLRSGNRKLIHADGHGGGGTLNPGGVTTGTPAPQWSTDPADLQHYNMNLDVGETNDTSGQISAAILSDLVGDLATIWGVDGVGRSRPATPIDVSQDFDADGIPDHIEFDDPDYDFLDPADADPARDSDGDGQGDLDEFAAGTDHRDPRSRFHIESIARSVADEVTLTWSSVPGKSYRIESTPDLDAESWTLFPEIHTADSTVETATLPSPSSDDPAFFRIRLHESIEGMTP